MASGLIPAALRPHVYIFYSCVRAADDVADDPVLPAEEKARLLTAMDQALLEAIKKKEIDPDDAYHHATDKKQFQQFVSSPETVPKTALLAG